MCDRIHYPRRYCVVRCVAGNHLCVTRSSYRSHKCHPLVDMDRQLRSDECDVHKQSELDHYRESEIHPDMEFDIQNSGADRTTVVRVLTKAANQHGTGREIPTSNNTTYVLLNHFI